MCSAEAICWLISRFRALYSSWYVVSYTGMQLTAFLPSGIVVRLPAALLACFSLQAHNNSTLYVTGLNSKTVVVKTTVPSFRQVSLHRGVACTGYGLTRGAGCTTRHLATKPGISFPLLLKAKHVSQQSSSPISGPEVKHITERYLSCHAASQHMSMVTGENYRRTCS